MFRQMTKEKESGLTKLIELLNEYEGQDTWSYDEEIGMPYYGWGDDCDYEAYLISKKYGFIKWLVENEKINKRKVFSFIDTADKPYEDILCLLALSDEPINDLISFLK